MRFPTFRFYTTGLGLLVLTFGLAHGQEAPERTETAQPAGIFKKVQGKAQIISADGGARRDPTAGVALNVGERVRTGADSGASLTLRDGSELVLGANTAVLLPRFEYDSATQEGHVLLDFLGGQLRILSGLIAKNKNDNMKIKTPTALVGVRGTDFILEAAPNHEN